MIFIQLIIILLFIFVHLFPIYILGMRNDLFKIQKDKMNERDIYLLVSHWFDYKKLLLINNKAGLSKYKLIATENKKKKAEYYAKKYSNDKDILNLKTTIKKINITSFNPIFTEAKILLLQDNNILKNQETEIVTDWKFLKEDGIWKVYQIGLLLK